MKKILVMLLAVLMLAACMVGCSETGTVNDTPNPETTEAPETGTPETGTPDATTAPTETVTFTVGFDAEFPPFGFIAADGSYDGFDLAIAEEACSRLGWEFVAQPIAWDSKDAELASGNIDCIWNGFTYEGREDQYTWSPAYYDSSVVMVVRADSGISSLADLAGKNVITQAGSSALTALQADEELTSTFADLIESADFNNAFLELGMGTADAVAADIGVAKYNMAGKEDEFVIVGEPVSVETYRIGFLLGNTETEEAIWQAVQAIAEDGTMGEIADRYVEYGLVKTNLCLIN